MFPTMNPVDTHSILLIMHEDFLQGNDRATPLRAGLVHLTTTGMSVPALNRLI